MWLLLIPSTSYRAHDFLEAAARLEIEVIVGCEQSQVLEPYSNGRTLTLSLRCLDDAVAQIAALHRHFSFAAIIGVDEETTVLAASASRVLALAHNSEQSVTAACNKYVFRQTLERAGVRSPRYWLVGPHEKHSEAATNVSYPCVLKPLSLSGSRGVIRADNRAGFLKAGDTIRKILKVTKNYPPSDAAILVESFIPGYEVALEGLLQNAHLRVLALFDKPDPLDGPFFEETIYVTPSRLSAAEQNQIAQHTQTAARALGLESGPVHAELRINPQGPWIVELGARTIGGLCSRAVRFSQQSSLEELVLRHALGWSTDEFLPDGTASGVMMIPIKKAGHLRQIHGLAAARSVPGIDAVVISIAIGERVVPLPAGNRYLGFIFAHGSAPKTRSQHCATRMRSSSFP